MHSKGMNLFIVDENPQMVINLKQTLNKRFGESLNISTFSDGESCLKKIDAGTDFVILAYFLQGANGNEILKSIKLINPKTEVIMLSSNEDVVTIIESFKAGASNYVVKDKNACTNVISHVFNTLTVPLRKMGREFGFTKFAAIFVLTFILMGVLVAFALKIIPY